MVPKMLIIVMLVGSACAATWRGSPPKKPKEFADKEGCYIEEINDVIPYGANVNAPGQCYVINCRRDLIDYASCGVVLPPSNNCHKVQDLNKPYPSCCPSFKCNDENEISKE